MLHVFNTIQYLERSLSLLITSALDLRTRTIKLCSFSSAYPYKHAVIHTIHLCVVFRRPSAAINK